MARWKDGKKQKRKKRQAGKEGRGNLESLSNRFGVTLAAFGIILVYKGQLWDHFGITLASHWGFGGHSGVTLGHFEHYFGLFRVLWAHGGATLGLLWGHFGITVRLFRHHFGVTLGVTLGSLWCLFGIALGASGPFGDRLVFMQGLPRGEVGQFGIFLEGFRSFFGIRRGLWITLASLHNYSMHMRVRFRKTYVFPMDLLSLGSLSGQVKSHWA